MIASEKITTKYIRYLQFLLEKIFELNKKYIFSIEKMRNSGNLGKLLALKF